MARFYYSNNEADFYRWCRHYIKEAKRSIYAFELEHVGSYYRSNHYDEYQDALIIMRQYHILLC